MADKWQLSVLNGPNTTLRAAALDFSPLSTIASALSWWWLKRQSARLTGLTTRKPTDFPWLKFLWIICTNTTLLSESIIPGPENRAAGRTSRGRRAPAAPHQLCSSKDTRRQFSKDSVLYSEPDCDGWTTSVWGTRWDGSRQGSVRPWEHLIAHQHLIYLSSAATMQGTCISASRHLHQ